MFTDAWEQRAAQAKHMLTCLKHDFAALEKQGDQLVQRIVDSESETVVRAYEAKLAKLEKDKLMVSEKLDQAGKPQRSFDEMFELACDFLSSPWKLWDSGQIHLRRTVLRLAFVERLAYSKDEGFSNPKKAMPFKVLSGFRSEKIEMARPRGFEPRTGQVEADSSCPLSYGRVTPAIGAPETTRTSDLHLRKVML